MLRAVRDAVDLRRMAMSSAACLAAASGVVACLLLLQQRLPTTFSKPFHERLQVELSPALFNLSVDECRKTEFCQRLVLACAPRQPGTNWSAVVPPEPADCPEMSCPLALPSLAADVQRLYLDNLLRQPDAYGIDYYCKKVSSMQLSVAEIRHRMLHTEERKKTIVKLAVFKMLDEIYLQELPVLLDQACADLKSHLCTRENLHRVTPRSYCALHKRLLSWCHMCCAALCIVMHLRMDVCLSELFGLEVSVCLCSCVECGFDMLEPCH